MNLETHNKYFRDVDYNKNQSVQWDVRTGVFEGAGAGRAHLPPGTPNYLTGIQTKSRTDRSHLILLPYTLHTTHYYTVAHFILKISPTL